MNLATRRLSTAAELLDFIRKCDDELVQVYNIGGVNRRGVLVQYHYEVFPARWTVFSLVELHANSDSLLGDLLSANLVQNRWGAVGDISLFEPNPVQPSPPGVTRRIRRLTTS